MKSRTFENRISLPPHRRLRVYAFDPALDTSLETAVINRLTLEVPWEEPLGPGPVGEYLEIVDVDPASGACYAPVNLNEPHLLAQDGLAPSEGNAQFHQQMVYGVASTAIQVFEEALGRRVLWSVPVHPGAGSDQYKFVRRLRLHPHGLREANAYYSPIKKAVLFGYFPATTSDPGLNLPGGIVFACLSHDIIVHEMTHALLDSMHRRFVEPSNPDVLAFHEAFADLVALFQHFSLPEVLRHQIARTRGDLAQQNLLAQLAQQFGQAIGQRGSLRDALGTTEDGVWKPKRPEPDELTRTFEPHARGSILVGAVFDAFLTIYRACIAPSVRVATGGTGQLPPGEMQPDLVTLLSEEAAKTARHVLQVCIRALDYCPPVDLNFGDYLRALITADKDLVPDDRLGYRVAFIEAFRRYGIYPLDVRSLAEESLLWRPPVSGDAEALRQALPSGPELRALVPDWGLTSDREEAFAQSQANAVRIHATLSQPRFVEAAGALGIAMGKDAPPSIYRKDGSPALEVHFVRPAYRTGPQGESLNDLIVGLTQRRMGYLDEDLQAKVDNGESEPPAPDFIFRGGCTLLIDLASGNIRYAVGKGIDSKRRMQSQRRYMAEFLAPTGGGVYFGRPQRHFGETEQGVPLAEPFALLHRSVDIEERP
jgi:hypothetical protein